MYHLLYILLKQGHSKFHYYYEGKNFVGRKCRGFGGSMQKSQYQIKTRKKIKQQKLISEKPLMTRNHKVQQNRKVESL